MDRRRKRAETVQSMADMVASIGQLQQPYSTIRDIGMRFATNYLDGESDGLNYLQKTIIPGLETTFKAKGSGDLNAESRFDRKRLQGFLG